MADTYTTNLNLTKPEPGAAEDTWGISLNADLDSLDAIFSTSGTQINLNPNQINFADNKKAIFGTGSDLQIYHDGSHSIIKDAGAGNLELHATNLIFKNSTGDSQYASFFNGGAVTLRYAGSPKVSTTSTGIDVTGTVTSDALTVQTAQGDISIDNSSSTLNFARAGASYIRATNSLGHFNFITGANNFTNKRLQIASNGDISFYDDTGTTQGLFWDASKESLAIGTTSLTPTDGANIELSSSTSSRVILDSTGTGGRKWTMATGLSGRLDFYDYDASAYRMSINASGNVGIGTTSPGAALHISGTSADQIRLERTNHDTFRIGLQSAVGLGFHNVTDNRTDIMIKGDGKVGIGTTSPTETLHVMSGVSNDTVAIISGSQSDRGLTISTYASDGRTDGGVDLDAYKSFKFTTDGTERASIDSSGNLAIGNTSAAAKLDIRQDSGSAIRCEDGSGAYFVVKQGGLVGIGTPSPDAPLTVHNSSDPEIRFGYSSTQDHKIAWDSSKVFIHADPENANGSSAIGFAVDGTERARIDSSGNLLVGTTNTFPPSDTGNEGVAVKPDNIAISRNASTPLFLDRMTSDGVLIDLRKDNNTGGIIGIQEPQDNAEELYIANGTGTSSVGLAFWDYINTSRIAPCNGTGAYQDNSIDLGYSGARFDDIYATNGTIQTSDRNEKQDIQALTDAEQRVATACKGLIRRFRWQDAVEEKGDDARLHFGVIAQDLQDAFTAEGLDAGDYGMFISSTWEDDDGVEQTRLGVRYNELLAFIITTL
jgi:hypothetical protein